MSLFYFQQGLDVVYVVGGSNRPHHTFSQPLLNNKLTPFLQTILSASFNEEILTGHSLREVSHRLCF